MQKIKFILGGIVIAGLFSLASCDKVDHPIIIFDADYDASTYGPPPSFNPATDAQKIKRVLVEDFTAHQCGNCPAAAIVAETIHEDHPDRITVMAIHAGSLAATDDDHYDTDWTTEESIVYWNQLDFQANPLGRVDRAPGAGTILAPAQWQEKAEERLAIPAVVALQMVTAYVPVDNVLNVHVASEFTEAYSGTTKLVILITESHMIDYQLDYDADEEEYPGGLVDDYEFNHVLRGSVNGALGLQLATNPESGFSNVKSYTYNFNNEWIPENCSVIAIVYDETTGVVLNIIENHLDA